MTIGDSRVSRWADDGRPSYVDRRPGKRPVLPSIAAARPARTGSRTLLLALVYAGLVVILATAPSWRLTFAPHYEPAPIHTDFGGSR